MYFWVVSSQVLNFGLTPMNKICATVRISPTMPAKYQCVGVGQIDARHLKGHGEVGVANL